MKESSKEEKGVGRQVMEGQVGRGVQRVKAGLDFIFSVGRWGLGGRRRGKSFLEA